MELETVEVTRSTQDVYRAHELPLHSKCIRVLDILPIPTGAPNDAPVTSYLRVVDIDTDSSFTALSYVWGKDAHSEPHSIQCDGVRFQVSRNCHSALFHLRQKLGAFTIWVDAICINQEDTAEKCQQIPLMGDIYSESAIVYVWLGEGTDSSDRAMDYLSRANFYKYIITNADGSRKYRRWAAGWSLFASRLSLTYHPFPFYSKPISSYLTCEAYVC
jgi:hypothetical protein